MYAHCYVASSFRGGDMLISPFSHSLYQPTLLCYSMTLFNFVPTAMWMMALEEPTVIGHPSPTLEQKPAHIKTEHFTTGKHSFKCVATCLILNFSLHSSQPTCRQWKESLHKHWFKRVNFLHHHHQIAGSWNQHQLVGIAVCTCTIQCLLNICIICQYL